MGSELPDIAKILAPLFRRVAAEHRPFLLAAAERLAAQRYRGWAECEAEPDVKKGLLACADREEAIARQVEALDAASDRIERRILAENPDLLELDRTVFEGRPLRDQLAIQASGERVGAASWRAFADSTPDEKARGVFLGCAELEIENAAFLESVLARGQ